MEKIYKNMKSVGILNLVLGIFTMAIGIAVGTCMIVSGGRLLKKKKELLF